MTASGWIWNWSWLWSHPSDIACGGSGGEDAMDEQKFEDINRFSFFPLSHIPDLSLVCVRNGSLLTPRLFKFGYLLHRFSSLMYTFLSDQRNKIVLISAKDLLRPSLSRARFHVLLTKRMTMRNLTSETLLLYFAPRQLGSSQYFYFVKKITTFVQVLPTVFFDVRWRSFSRKAQNRFGRDVSKHLLR